MTAQRPANTVLFQVITGGQNRAANQPPDTTAALPRAPHLGADALAAQMAELYALALIRDLPLDAPFAPDDVVRIDGVARFTLHDLLCELHRLPWFSRHTVPSGDAFPAGTLSPSRQGVAGHRAVLRHGCDGRSVLDNLWPDQPGPDGSGRGLSAFLALCPPRDHSGGEGAAPTVHCAMSHWSRWIAATTGAELPFPGRAGTAQQGIATPRDLAGHTRRHGMQAPYGAALWLLARGMPLDAGLRSGWNGPRLMAVMTEAAQRAQALSDRMRARPGRMVRPGVTAARLTLMQAGEDMQTGGESACLHSALVLLNRHCPRLLTWIAQFNTQLGTGRFALPDRDGGHCDGWSPLHFGQNLMLPQMPSLHPGEATGRTLLVGTMMTLLKAVFASDSATLPGTDRDLGAECDTLAANMALGRLMSSGIYPSESRQSLRMGQSLALQVLRCALESDCGPASLTLTDFDGQRLRLCRRGQGAGLSRVTLEVDGVAALWPSQGESAGPILTAVV
ncbi:hypothetical protein [Puniceibacterium sp. IMCC21224]|uniref:hypothetical protein n=1 Tax=Puniceibacterium sp. IMCC21224 TaxID=1618204 RepID=UPI00064DD50A|nr:hypothetical protein [Puniceibacterium sp. IMCC21224]KMK65763.1 hypothetical protein IMCC21224_11598 [Puniceibacterium sp. IMCC21224]